MTTFRTPKVGEVWRYKYRPEADDWLNRQEGVTVLTDMRAFTGHTVRIVRPLTGLFGPGWFSVQMVEEEGSPMRYVAASWELEPLESPR